ncbi:MAG TPA: hypothetical protein VFP68_23060 [Burkholderiaceae bacterium]|nr:hypothetical protein [Burkholderiaceae bacterium]
MTIVEGFRGGLGGSGADVLPVAWSACRGEVVVVLGGCDGSAVMPCGEWLEVLPLA